MQKTFQRYGNNIRFLLTLLRTKRFQSGVCRPTTRMLGAINTDRNGKIYLRIDICLFF